MNRIIFSILIIGLTGFLLSWIFVIYTQSKTKEDKNLSLTIKQKNICKKVLDEKTIIISNNQYSPTTLAIKQCTKVTFINNDNTPHWPASDFHPTHGIYPEFDPKRALEPGENWSFVFEKKGKWSFHDHLYPTTYGTIDVR